MTAANDPRLDDGRSGAVDDLSDTYPRTIEIEARLGDPQVSRPVVYKLDFKRIAAKKTLCAS